MDGLEVIYSDGGGFSFDDATGANPAAYFADATRSYIQLLRKPGITPDFVYWNWVLDFWSWSIFRNTFCKNTPSIGPCRTM